jgi:hypothetical protein
VAKKIRTPPPPKRPVQAPKQRTDARSPQDRRTRLYLMLFAASGVVILGAVLVFVAFAGGGGGGAGVTESGLIKTKDCVEKSYPGLTPAHIQNPDQKVKYNSFPPSSGPHYQSPAPWNIYPDPVQQTILVHNLEHGGIILQYGKVGQAVVSKIQSFYQGDPYGLVVAPYPKLGTKIAASAWNEPSYSSGDRNFNQAKPGKGFVLTCAAFDQNALAKFRDNHRNQGGERYASVKDMAPGT